MTTDERFICFPISIDSIKCGVNPDTSFTQYIHIVKPMDGWDKLQKSVSIEGRHGIALRTGEVAGITAVVDGVDMTAQLKTPRVYLYNNRHGVIFQYEPTLSNIHEVMPRTSIINDGMFLLTGDTHNVEYAEYEILKMPADMLARLEQAIESSNSQVYEFLYELINILPDNHFNELELFMNIVYVVKNAKGIDDNARIATLNKLVVERSWTFLAEDMAKMFSRKMKNVNKRYTYLSLVKFMRTLNDDIHRKVDQWQSKWNNKNKNKHRTTITYLSNTATSLLDIKNACPTLTTKKILAIDSRFHMVRINICKSCRNRHIKGCCSQYSRYNGTKLTMIENATLT